MNDVEHDKFASVRGEMNPLWRFGAEDGPVGTATNNQSFLNKSTVFLKAIGGKD